MNRIVFLYLKKPILKSNKGVALLVVLAIMTVLITAGLELNRNARSALFASAAKRDKEVISGMALSGINIACAILAKDKMDSDLDSLQEDWADPEKTEQVVKEVISFNEGELRVVISDELGKIQVNAIVSFPEGRDFNNGQLFMWERFLENFVSEDEICGKVEPVSIINSLKDWIDSGDDDTITGLTGAESDYYQSLESPYTCGNRPVHHLAELLFIKNIKPELFYGTKEFPGMSNYLTVFGVSDTGGNTFSYNGKININTASLPVLAAILPEESKDLAEAIYEYRMETADGVYINNLSEVTWYKQVPGCGDMDIDENIIKIASDIFRIEAHAKLHGAARIITAVVKREKYVETGKWKCSVLQQYLN